MAGACSGDLVGLRDQALLFAGGRLGRAVQVRLGVEHIGFDHQEVTPRIVSEDRKAQAMVPPPPAER